MKILVTAEVKKAIDDLNKTEKAAKGLGDAFAKMRDFMQGPIAAGKDIARVLGKVVDVGKQLYTEFANDELAVIQLNSALDNAGTFATGAAGRFEEFAAQLQATTLYGDDVTKSQIAQLAAFGKSESEIKKIITAATNLASATGVDLDTAVRQLNATLVGNAGYLGRQNAAVRALTEEELKQGKAIDIVNKQYAGMAETVGKGALGAMTQFKNAVGDLRESLGGDIAERFKPLLTNVTSLVNKWTASREALRRYAKAQSNLTIQSQADARIALEGELAAAELDRKKQEAYYAKLNQGPDTSIMQALRQKENKIVAMINEVDARILSLSGKSWADEPTQSLAELEAGLVGVSEAAESVDSAAKALVQSYGDWTGELEDQYTASNDLAIGVEAWLGETEDAIEATREWSGVTKELTELQKSGLSGAIAITEAFGAAIVSGEDGWKAFGRAGLNAIAGIIEAMALESDVLIAKTIAEVGLGQFWKTPGLGAAIAASAGAHAAAGAVRAIPMANGGDVMVNKPTLFLAGEAGPERATFTPISRGGGGGINVVQHIYGTVISERQLNQRIRSVAAGSNR